MAPKPGEVKRNNSAFSARNQKDQRDFRWLQERNLPSIGKLSGNSHKFLRLCLSGGRQEQDEAGSRPSRGLEASGLPTLAGSSLAAFLAPFMLAAADEFGEALRLAQHGNDPPGSALWGQVRRGGVWPRRVRKEYVK